MTKEQTNEQSTAIAIQDTVPEWLQKGNRGSEDVTANDMIIPRIDVLQALSPQIKKKDPAYIEGAEQGQLFNTVTGEIYGAEIIIVPVLFRREHILWKLRDAGGGFFGAFKTAEEADAALLKLESQKDYEVVECHQHFVMVLNKNGSIEEAVLSMTKSKMKVSRNLNTLVQVAGVDRFAKAYRITAIEATGPKGDYWSYKVVPEGFVPHEVYKRGSELYEMIKSGAADVDRSQDGHNEEKTVAAELD